MNIQSNLVVADPRRDFMGTHHPTTNAPFEIWNTFIELVICITSEASIYD